MLHGNVTFLRIVYIIMFIRKNAKSAKSSFI